MGEKKTTTIICILIALAILTATFSQAMRDNSKNIGEINTGTGDPWRGGSLALWEDDFLNETKIDQSLSHHYVVDTNAGLVSMENTYPAWIDPTFTRMKPISVTNSGTQTISNYDVNLTVLYDADMQVDFDDLRFTDDVGVPLSFYKLKKTDGVSAEMLVKIPLLPPGQTTIMMFYGNPTAADQSNFGNVFTWRERSSVDFMVSHKHESEGAWDPDVEYGGSRFLVSWEERIGPEDVNVPLPNWERTYPSYIHGRTYNTTGGDPYPDPELDLDIDISDPLSNSYHAENPAIAYGAGKFFVVWEENVADQPLQRYEADIKGALVTPDGQVTNRFTICNVALGQFDPQVAYDSQSNRFFVVWEDGRNGADDYDVRGRLYTSNGNPIGSDFAVAYASYYQGEPWITGDQKGYFLIVFEHGVDPEIGPFSLYAYRYDSNGNRVGSQITIASGSEYTDYIFPAIGYNQKTERYFVTWNDGDISQDPSDRRSYEGDVWGKILSRTGGIIKNNFVIESGSNIRTDVVPFFETMFFIVYNGRISDVQDIYGRLVSSEGSLMTSRQELSDGSSLNVDWNNIAVGPDGVFVSWEDERDVVSLYADVFAYVWGTVQSIGSSNVTAWFGEEEVLITEAQVTSVPITPEDFREWRQFSEIDTLPENTDIRFDIMDHNGTVLLKEDVENGENISEITDGSLRVRATFSRVTPQVTPILDLWNVSCLVGRDIYPPVTTIAFDPAEPNGNNSWYISPVTVTFNVSDVDSDPENITTYYNINGVGVEIYNPVIPPVISSEGAENIVEYWSNDSINEELPHQRAEGIKIDTSPPMITLYEPSYIIAPGNVSINGSATEYFSGSGMKSLSITVNDETIFDETYTGEQIIWFEWRFTADRGETYDIYVEATDIAGHTIADRRTVLCPDHGLYDPGYIYLFENPRIGPVNLLVTLGLSIAVNYDTLYVVLPGVHPDAVSVKFTAKQVFLGGQFVFLDTNLSDGCSCDLLVPFGFYEITAIAYDDGDTVVEEYSIITKMLILLF